MSKNSRGKLKSVAGILYFILGGVSPFINIHLKARSDVWAGGSASDRLHQSFFSKRRLSRLLPPPPSHPRCSPWQRDVALQNRTGIYVTARGERSEWKERSGTKGRGCGAYVGEFQSAVNRAEHVVNAATGATVNTQTLNLHPVIPVI